MDIDALTDHYTLLMTQSFSSACGLTALHLALEDLTPESRKAVKEAVIKQWRGSWVDQMNGSITKYANVVAGVKNSHLLNQPEDMQVAVNRALAAVEKTARISLRMEETT